MRLKGTRDFNFKFQLENFFGLAGNDKERYHNVTRRWGKIGKTHWLVNLKLVWIYSKHTRMRYIYPLKFF